MNKPLMLISAFDYDLPDELIAQAPPQTRGSSRMLVLDRRSGSLTHRSVDKLPELLQAGDLLVVNDTRVIPARLLGHRVPSGGAVECLLLAKREANQWEALVHPGQKLRPGECIRFERDTVSLEGEIDRQLFFGRRLIRLWRPDGGDVEAAVDAIGHVPLPPYIKRPDVAEDAARYQTVYARARGSVAAPTAGLHLTTDLLGRLADLGVQRVDLTLHVGYGTFKPVRVEQVDDHTVDAEAFEIPIAAATAISMALQDGRRIVAVGTTTTRALESATDDTGRVVAGGGVTDLFIRPGFSFRTVGALLTNFHLPRSSLLMLVCAFAGREAVLAAYREAVERRYRFYSYGDCMLVL